MIEELVQERAKQLIDEWKLVAEWHDKTYGPDPERNQQLLISAIADCIRTYLGPIEESKVFQGREVV